MSESTTQNYNHLKIHSQYSICEGAIKIDDLKEFSKTNKIQSLGLSDTTNLCGALEFAEKISKVGTQPIIGTQINFKFNDTLGLLPLFALDEEGYKRIIKLSSFSFLNNDELSEPHLDFNELLEDTHGVAILSGTIFGLFGQLFDKGKFSEIHDLYSKIKSSFGDRFYLEIQRHNNTGEKAFENFLLKTSEDLDLPVIATNLGGNMEILENGNNGLLIPYNDSKKAANLIINYSNDIKLQGKHLENSKNKDPGEIIIDPPKPGNPPEPGSPPEPGDPPEDPPVRELIEIKLADDHIVSIAATTFWGPDGKPISAQDFIKRMFGELPENYNLVVNSNHSLVSKILVEGNENKEMIQQFLDLALLSQGLLKGEKLTEFIKRSVNLI